MRERIRNTMAAVFLLAVESLPDDSAIDAVPEWDSLRHLELMLALEMEFGVRISTSAMLELLSLQAIEEYLQSVGANIPG